MSTTAACAKCQLADWPLTPSGRIKKSTPGRCKAPMPAQKPPPLLCIMVSPPWHRVAVWPDYVGPCEAFKPKEPR